LTLFRRKLASRVPPKSDQMIRTPVSEGGPASALSEEALVEIGVLTL